MLCWGSIGTVYVTPLLVVNTIDELPDRVTSAPPGVLSDDGSRTASLIHTFGHSHYKQDR